MRSLRAPTLIRVFGKFSSAGLCSRSSNPQILFLKTLHVNTNLLQVSTLVLTQRQAAVRPIPINRFNISLDSGHPFHPTAIHLEGDDPITLVVLLDASGNQDKLLKTFSHDFAAHHAVAGNQAGAVSRSPTIFTPPTTFPSSRWTATLSAHWITSRPILLLSGPGLLPLSKTPRSTPALTKRPVTIPSSSEMQSSRSSIPWATRPVGGPPPLRLVQLGHRPLSRPLRIHRWHVYPTTEANLEKTLQAFVTMLRGRYILEFPRPDQSKAGLHSIRITTPKSHNLVVSTGISFSLPDPGSLIDPDTIQSSKSPAVFGTRRPTPPPR